MGNVCILKLIHPVDQDLACMLAMICIDTVIPQDTCMYTLSSIRSAGEVLNYFQPKLYLQGFIL